MGQPIATINGVSVYSDKQLVSVNNGRLVFADGSTCNPKTGEVNNSGPGYIRIGNEDDVSETVTKDFGPWPDAILKISGINADINIKTTTYRSGITATAEGPKNQVEALEFSHASKQLLLTSKSSSENNIIFGNIVNVRQSVVVGPSMRIEFTVTHGTSLEISDVNGRVKVDGSVDNLKLDVSGSSESEIDETCEAEIKIGGSGNVNIKKITGSLRVKISGSGAVVVNDGKVTDLDVKISGNGSYLMPRGEVNDAHLRISGSGNIYVYQANNKPDKKVSGSGSIEVGNWN